MKQLVLLFALTVGTGFSQQLPHASTWSFFQYAINPAHTGIKPCLEVQGSIRGQWIGVPGAPVTGWLGFHAPLKAKRKRYLSGRHGFGGLLISDKIGPFQSTTLLFNYAGHFNFSQNNRLSMGLGIGAKQLAFNRDIASPLDPDPAINGSATELLPDMRFGAWYNAENWFVGGTLYQMIPSKWSEIGRDASSKIHGMVNAGWRIPINQYYTVMPQAYFGFTSHGTFDVQVQGMLDVRGKMIAGLGIRNTDAFIGMIGFRIDEKWKFMYAYDFVMSSLRPNSFHTHEITLGFSPCSYLSSTKNNSTSCPLFD